MDAIENSKYETLCFVCGSQMGKTDAVLDLIGWRLETKPRPQLYVGPSKDFIVDQLEPRIKLLLDESPALRELVARGKREKRTRKLIAGVSLRLAWAGSATQLSSDQAGDVYVDELDRMGADVEHEGDPLALVKARAFTYRDRKYVVTSTPKMGTIDTEIDTNTGLEFWTHADELASPIWQLWQAGTRWHWAWPCAHCSEFFIPRFSTLRWPEGSTPEQARWSAYLACPKCGGVLDEGHKEELNSRGVFVAPGQSVTAAGEVLGDPPRALVGSFWVSGLASPFVSFGERAAAFLEAANTREAEKIQGVVNTGFGELFAPGGGDAPDYKEVVAKRAEGVYRRGEVPETVKHVTLTVDVQKDRLYWIARGWAARAESWLIDHGAIFGATVEDEVWVDLAQFVTQPLYGMPLRLVLIDSGFRPGSPVEHSVNKVYDFCRRFPRLVRATKGSSSPMRTPMIISRVDVNAKGGKYGLELVRLDTDYWKCWVHERIRWPSEQEGAWHIPNDVDDEYCHQIVSEARLRKPSGRIEWVARYKDNHYFDCEAMQGAASYMLGMHRIMTVAPQPAPEPPPERAQRLDMPMITREVAPAARPQRSSSQSSFMNKVW